MDTLNRYIVSKAELDLQLWVPIGSFLGHEFEKAHNFLFEQAAENPSASYKLQLETTTTLFTVYP